MEDDEIKIYPDNAKKIKVSIFILHKVKDK